MANDKLCEKCHEKITVTGKKLCRECAIESLGQIVLVSEVLMYAKHHRHAATRDNITKIMAAFFNIDELKEAKDKLWEAFAAVGLLGDKMNRRGSSNRSEHMAVCDDILEALCKLESENIDFKCYACRWDRIPKSSPETACNVMLSERLAAVEAMLKVHNQNLSELRSDVMKHESALEKVEGISSTRSNENEVAALPVARSGASGDTGAVDEEDDVLVAGGEQGDEHGAVGGQSVVNDDEIRSMSPVPRNSRSQANQVRNIIHNDTSRVGSFAGLARSLDDNSFRQPSHVIRRNKKNQNRIQRQTNSNTRDNNRLVGTSTTSEGLTAAPTPSRDFFVWRVHKSVTVEKMSNFVKKKGVQCRNMVKTSHKESVNASFKVSVALDDVAKIFNADFWPKGIYVRKWKTRSEERVTDL